MESESTYVGTTGSDVPSKKGMSLIYEHDVYGLSEKLTDIQHHYHDVIISTLHVHLDEKNCMEVILVRGKVEKLKNSIMKFHPLSG